MTYQVLARKWRPKNFQEMVGQTHVLKALINALDSDRVHHAFLYTGTRGVGKTTLARILAKALNCERGVSSKPCGKCSACVEIDAGNFVDLIEVDAASRTKVEDTRELLDNVQYAPTRGRFKIYLIDEVHMLSTHSFNALLKTLEEPPAHIKFLLATTDPQKLPVTILSRCLQFNLKRLSIEQIAQQLEKILKSEKIKFEDEGVRAIARAADGSMRDALSLMDQAISYANGKLTSAVVLEMLGSIQQSIYYDIVKALVDNQANQLMDIVQQAAQFSPNYMNLLDDLISFLHRIALVQLAPEAVDDWYEDKDKLKELAALLDEEQLQLFYQIALHGKKDLPLSPDAKSGFEMLMLRMLAFQPGKKINVNANSPTNTDKNKQTQEASSVSPNVSNKSQLNKHAVKIELNEDQQKWLNIVANLNTAATAKQLAKNSILVSMQKKKITLILNQKLKQLATDNAKARLENALAEILATKIKLELQIGDTQGFSPAEIEQQAQLQRQAAAVESVEKDAVVQEMQSILGAKVIPEYVESNNNTD